MNMDSLHEPRASFLQQGFFRSVKTIPQQPQLKTYCRIPMDALLNHDDAFEINMNTKANIITPLDEPQAASHSNDHSYESVARVQYQPATAVHALLHLPSKVPISPISNDSQTTPPGGKFRNTETTTRVKRNKWTPEEDATLMHIVKKHGAKDWGMLATYLPDRSADNVRLRYMYFLRYPEEVRERPFSKEEDARIMKEAVSGTHQWNSLSKELGRSSGAIRNRFDVLKRLSLRHQKKEQRVKAYREQLKVKLDEMASNQ